MATKSVSRTVGSVIAGGAAAIAASYAATVAFAYVRYGRPAPAREADAEDALLDRFMPLYDVVERHRIAVAAPAGVTLDIARDLDMTSSPIVRAIFKGRELVLHATPPPTHIPRGLMASVTALGWGVLAEVPGREIVMGAVTKPWEADVAFRKIAPEAFHGFAEPGYVKIAWTLRADPAGDASCVFRTETRAIATDMRSREKFRRFWAVFSPGIALIRRLMLQPVKCAAERHARGRAGVAEGLA